MKILSYFRNINIFFFFDLFIFEDRLLILLSIIFLFEAF